MNDFSLLMNPKFDSQEGWGDGYRLARSEEGGVVVGPGVDNPNVFAQRFTLHGRRNLRVTVEARSALPAGGKAMVQINWYDSSNKFLDVTKIKFDVSDSRNSREQMSLSAPPEADIGIAYVLPGDAESVVRYFEMTLVSKKVMPPIPNILFTHIENHFAVEVGRDKSFWERMTTPAPICFVHIPKTAGHSVYALLEENFKPECRLFPYQGVEGNTQAVLKSLELGPPALDVFGGHMPFGAHNYLGDCRYLTFLRNPFSMTISGFYFNAESSGAPHHQAFVSQNRTLLQFAESADNMMVRYLLNCSFENATYWLSEEVKPNVAGNAYIGLDLGNDVAVRSFALQQWSYVPYPTRYHDIGGVEKVAIECSNDGFNRDVRLVAEASLKQNRELNLYPLNNGNAVKVRYWRVRALSGGDSPRWGVVSLRFFPKDPSGISPTDFERDAVQGTPICSGSAKGFPPSQAFDGRDRRALLQISPNSLDMGHCEEAMYNLRHNFLSGIVENYDRSVHLLGEVLGLSKILIEKRNNSMVSRSVDMLSENERREVAELNKYDLILYDYAQKLFQSDLEYMACRKAAS